MKETHSLMLQHPPNGGPTAGMLSGLRGGDEYHYPCSPFDLTAQMEAESRRPNQPAT